MRYLIPSILILALVGCGSSGGGGSSGPTTGTPTPGGGGSSGNYTIAATPKPSTFPTTVSPTSIQLNADGSFILQTTGEGTIIGTFPAFAPGGESLATNVQVQGPVTQNTIYVGRIILSGSPGNLALSINETTMGPDYTPGGTGGPMTPAGNG